MTPSPGTRLGPYEITAQIGMGGMGEVYRATDTKLDRDVAIKVLPQSLAGDPDRIARFQREAKTLETLLENPGIIRNRLKVRAAVTNAQAFLRLQEEYGRFDTYVWQFVGGKAIQTSWRSMNEVPATSPESDALSKDLKRRGFTFVGSTIIYAHMQAVGMVNDHVRGCFRHRECAALGRE